MHTCLTGPPGVGKTTLGKILAELYCCMGFLKTDKFKLVTSADLIGGYLGQTALKTKKVLKESLGGVLFIDEAYSIGSGDEDRGNSYSKECIDTINQFLSEHTSNFIMIIAGYHNELERCFFSMNAGLRRRFPWTYDIKNYSINNLREIFVYQVCNNNWSLDPFLTESNLDNLFKEYPDIFKNNGGDTVTLFDKSKMERTIAKNQYGLYSIPKSVKYTYTADFILKGGVHEDTTIEYIKSIGGDIIHAGSGFGDFLPALKNCNKVWTFEPNTLMYESSLETISLNNLVNVQKI